MAESRIYVVTSGGKDRLIEAANKAQALAYAAKTTFVVKVAGQKDLIALVAAGVAVEMVRDRSEDSGV